MREAACDNLGPAADIDSNPPVYSSGHEDPSMQGRRNAAATPRKESSRADQMSATERRRELAGLIAAGIARAIALRAEPPAKSPEPEDSGVDGLARSATSRLSVRTGGTPDRNESKVGEHA